MDGLEDIDPDILFKTDDGKTFQYQSELPSLPVPDLQHTLNRYLDSGDLFALFEMMLYMPVNNVSVMLGHCLVVPVLSSIIGRERRE